MAKTIAEINEKIASGSVCVVTAEEMSDIVDDIGAEKAAAEVDVVTTGTFGAMCSSGVFLNFGHSDIPIKITKMFMNDVEAYSGIAAVDSYLGATQISEKRGIQYGGAHVIEDLICGKEVEVTARSYGTDCYPRKELTTTITLDDLNQAIMVNPRNAYQRYDAATNGSKKTIHTYMGKLLPDFKNVTYSGAGILSPLSNDPTYRTIGAGTKIFMGGAEGTIVGEGTQCSTASGFATLMTTANLKEMTKEYVNAASFEGYGTSLFLGIGIPIPILDAEMAQAAAVRDADIEISIKDYSIGKRDRPVVRKANYEELRSGSIQINGKETATSCMSSFKKSREVAEELKKRIVGGKFFLGANTTALPTNQSTKPMKETNKTPVVGDIMSKRVITVEQTESFIDAAKLMKQNGRNHISVVSNDKLVGIITSWDISKAVAEGKTDTVEACMTRDVITCTPDETADVVAKRLAEFQISAIPVIDDNQKVLGMLTSDHISKLFTRGKHE
ncbi:Inosine-5'-monophosphate dehydrogenase [Methanimicrococcus sp. At1]|uniref:Inosine-5'-monophosphate dehydrogenase n=1 Tax=Methanimicrococcus hacksteinii TaxID=3028293 RepID=A0ABU3VNZ2_9EURY|nr:homocysteine biosynthesis protein [Methanimicrococcus sp. At1]MDV0445025.1 Inosine-5'-monophosphate dehydrogenase [Methanimicrococcus sp. At1]